MKHALFYFSAIDINNSRNYACGFFHTQEINRAAEVIYDNVHPDANIIFGAMIDSNVKNGEVGSARLLVDRLID